MSLRLTWYVIFASGISAVVSAQTEQPLRAEDSSVSLRLVHRILVDSSGQPDKFNPRNAVAVECAEFSPDGKTFATATKGDHTVQLWETESGRLLWTAKTGGETEAVTFVREGRFVLAGGADARLHTFDLQGTELAVHKVEGSIEGLRANPANTLLASGDDAGTIVIWDITADDPTAWRKVHEQVITDGPRKEADVNQLDWTSDGRYLVAAERDGDVSCWNVMESGGLTFARSFDGFESTVKSVRLSPDNRLVAAGAGSFGGVRLWNFQTGALVVHIASGNLQPTKAAPIAAERFETVEFSPEGKWLLVGGTFPWQNRPVPITIFSIEDLKQGQVKPAERIDTWRQEYFHFSPDGSRLLTSHDDGTVRLWRYISD